LSTSSAASATNVGSIFCVGREIVLTADGGTDHASVTSLATHGGSERAPLQKKRKTFEGDFSRNGERVVAKKKRKSSRSFFRNWNKILAEKKTRGALLNFVYATDFRI
jgi:hypothetical protein